MTRIRRIYDYVLPVNKDRLHQVNEILKKQCPEVPEEEITLTEDRLRTLFKQRFRMILLTAENLRGKVSGFAILLHEPGIGFAFLDRIIEASGKVGAVSDALFRRVRQESCALKVRGLFFECPSDDASACQDPAIVKINRRRLRFFERYGARPIINTAYEMPVKDKDPCMPCLVYDGLASEKPLEQAFARKAVRAILERKISKDHPADYVERIIASFNDDPVRLRDFRYIRPEMAAAGIAGRSVEPIALIINERHEILYIDDPEYVEAPIRIRSILSELEKSDMFLRVNSKTFPDVHIKAVHDPAFVDFLRKTCKDLPEGKLMYPYFPSANEDARPVDAQPAEKTAVLLGHYSIDAFTPITHNVYTAARQAVNCGLTAAREIVNGRRKAYALVRPPGHHAVRGAYGGFCFLNNTAIAAHFLSAYGRVAILDVDYHHGNGQQDIFYRRSDVLTVSIHGSPEFAYPHYCGFADEKGEKEGEGFNLNLPLPEQIDENQYLNALKAAIRRIEEFDPQFLVVALGLDPAKDDPTGSWSMTAGDFENNGRLIGALDLPTLVIQEGGYLIQTLGRNAEAFFKGLVDGSGKGVQNRREPRQEIQGLTFRHEPVPADAQQIRKLVELTGFFYPAEVDIAEELVNERIARGQASGYFFVLAEHGGRIAGYACYGPISGTVSSYDLYWIAVLPEFQGRGLGRILIHETEKLIAAAGGSRIYVDTSLRPQYAGTRTFYENCGYRLESVLKDFYGPGDGKAIYCKLVAGK